MNDNFSKNFKWMIYLLAIVLLDIHLMTLQLEFRPSFQFILPIFDLIVLGLTYYFITKDKRRYLLALFILFMSPVVVLALALVKKIAGLIISEYYFFALLVKIVLFLAFIHALLRKNEAWRKSDQKFAFLFFLLLLVLPNLFYVLCDFTPPSWDPTRHSKNAFHIFNLIFGDMKGLWAAYMHYDLYPSVSYLICVPFILLFGKSNDALVLSIILFWLPLSYYYTKKVFSEIFKASEEHAILTSFIYHSNILFLSYYKQFLLDFQPIALIPVYYYYIYRSTYFNNKKYSIIAGCILGIGFLSKQSFLLYAAPMVAVLGVKLVKTSANDFKMNREFYFKKWMHFFIHILCGLAIIIPWFGGWQFMYSYEMSQVPAVARIEGDPEPLTFASVIWYFPGILYSYTWPFLLLLIVGWFLLIKKKKFYTHLVLAAASVLLIYVAMTLNHNKDLRYISGAFFFVGFGYAGLSFIQERFRNYVLMIAALISFGYSIHLVSWNKTPIVSLELNNYVLPESPQSPAFHNEAEAVASLEKIILELPNPEEYKVLKHTLIGQDVYYNSYSIAAQRNMLAIPEPIEYDSLLHPNLSVTQEVYATNYTVIHSVKADSSSHFLFGKDPFYPSYYLFKLTTYKDKGMIQIIGFEGNVEADVRMIIHQHSNNSVIETKETWVMGKKALFSILPGTDKLELNMNIHHHKGRWELIYLNKFTPYFGNNYLHGTLIPYSKNINEQRNWIIPIN